MIGTNYTIKIPTPIRDAMKRRYTNTFVTIQYVTASVEKTCCSSS
jgi:hypothetical protein